MSKFEYLNQSGCTEVESLPDKVLHQEVMQSFSTMKFSSDEVDGIFRVISGVLLLGNLQFDGSTLT
jgi:myosin heavy subunit